MSFHDRWPFRVHATTTTPGHYDSTYWTTLAGAMNQAEGLLTRDDITHVVIYLDGTWLYEMTRIPC